MTGASPPCLSLPCHTGRLCYCSVILCSVRTWKPTETYRAVHTLRLDSVQAAPSHDFQLLRTLTVTGPFWSQIPPLLSRLYHLPGTPSKSRCRDPPSGIHQTLLTSLPTISPSPEDLLVGAQNCLEAWNGTSSRRREMNVCFKNITCFVALRCTEKQHNFTCHSPSQILDRSWTKECTSFHDIYLDSFLSRKLELTASLSPLPCWLPCLQSLLYQGDSLPSRTPAYICTQASTWLWRKHLLPWKTLRIINYDS